nr:MAG TPA: hypothetical protein [Caudoviricetes sp.]
MENKNILWGICRFRKLLQYTDRHLPLPFKIQHHGYTDI